MPEGGYGWVVVSACSVITFWFVGTTYAWICDLLSLFSLCRFSALRWSPPFPAGALSIVSNVQGILQAAFVAEKVASTSTLSFVGPVTAVFIAVLAIANARLIRWLGARKTALLGISLIGIGELSASFTTKSITGLFVTAGAVMGAGVRCVGRRGFVLEQH